MVNLVADLKEQAKEPELPEEGPDGDGLGLDRPRFAAGRDEIRCVCAARVRVWRLVVRSTFRNR